MQCIGLLICEVHLEEAVNMILGSAVLHAGVGVFAHHVVDGVHNVCHLLQQDRKS